MLCPKCLKSNVIPVGTTHYICNNPECSVNGLKTQFKFVIDDEIRFPYNQIFINRSKEEFYRKPYLQISSKGNNQI